MSWTQMDPVPTRYTGSSEDNERILVGLSEFTITARIGPWVGAQTQSQTFHHLVV